LFSRHHLVEQPEDFGFAILSAVDCTGHHPLSFSTAKSQSRWLRNEFIASKCGHRISKVLATNQKSDDGQSFATQAALAVWRISHRRFVRLCSASARQPTTPFRACVVLVGIGFETRSASGGRGAVLVANLTRPVVAGMSVRVIGIRLASRAKNAWGHLG
jgi:hypothetical protein